MQDFDMAILEVRRVNPTVLSLLSPFTAEWTNSLVNYALENNLVFRQYGGEKHMRTFWSPEMLPRCTDNVACILKEYLENFRFLYVQNGQVGLLDDGQFVRRPQSARPGDIIAYLGASHVKPWYQDSCRFILRP